MKIYKGTIETVYKDLIEDLKQQNIVANTKEINNCCLIVDNPSLENLHFPYRNISGNYAIEEMKWYWSADNSCHTIGQHAKMWLNISDDGETSNSAYGYIIQKKYDYNQLEQIIELLTKDPTSRRAVLNISDPQLNKITTKDMQCTIAIQFLIRNGKLEETVYMRSNDVYYGLPYDYIFFVSLGTYIAKRLNLKLEKYIHHATSMHMYLKDEDRFKRHNQSLTIHNDKLIDMYYKGEVK